MQNLNKNGAYVERRKMYIEYRKHVIKAFHNMKSKVPIEWTDQNRMTYQKNRILAKQFMEKEYIKNIYNQKMERIIRDKYNPNYDPYNQISNDSFTRPQRDVLSQQVQQFNTSKLMPPSPPRNNPENTYQLPHETYRKNIENQQNPSQVRYQQQLIANGERRERYPDDRKEKQENENSERGYSNGERVNRQKSYNEAPRMYEQPRYDYYPNEKPQNINREGSSRKSSGELSRQSSNYQHDHPNKNYYGIPSQNSYNSRLREYRRSIEFPSQQKPQHPYHPFRNNLPDRLQEFLREKTKADRKSNMSIDLVSRQKSF